MNDKNSSKKESKIIANYLPQYHEIPENNEWWGQGFTDWVSVRSAKPLFEGHEQPKIPLGRNYYSLDKVDSIRWQAELAREYGVYGFGFYHYWFSTELKLLQKPAELLLEDKSIDINFMFIWDNLTWKRTWSNLGRGNDWAPAYDNKSINRLDDNGVLAEVIYGGEEDWRIHYDYLRPFFKDDRYIKIDNRPVFSVFQPRNDIKTLKLMTEYWNQLAKNDGFDGILFLSKDSVWPERLERKMKYAPFAPTNIKTFLEYKCRDYVAKRRGTISQYTYDECWQNILKDAIRAKSGTYLCGFVSFDDSPRRGERARIVRGSSPAKFKKYLSQLIDISSRQGKEYVFLMAWNEWGEGAYLEPDEKYQYAYLEALREVVRGDA